MKVHVHLTLWGVCFGKNGYFSNVQLTANSTLVCFDNYGICIGDTWLLCNPFILEFKF